MASSSGADIVIVGGGVIGLLSAWELSKTGKRKIILLDKGEPGREASWAAAGILSPLGPWRYPEAIQTLTNQSRSIYPELCEELRQASGVDPELERSGLLTLLDGDEEGKARAWVETAQVSCEMLTREEAERRFPVIFAPGPALWMPDVAQLRSPRLLRALLAALEQSAVEVRADEPVRKLRLENEAVTGVETAQGIIESDSVVLAAGAWTPELLPRGTWRPEIRPVKGQMLLYESSPDLLQAMVLQGSRYLVPRRDGRILAGSTMEDEGFNKSPTLEVKQELRAFAESLLPALAERRVEAHWTGLRPASPDGVPIVGPHPEINGVWLNCGHHRNGVALAPATVRQLVRMMF